MYTTQKMNNANNHCLATPSRSGHMHAINLLLAAIFIWTSTCLASPSAPSRQRLLELAKTDHIELLKWSMALYDQNIQDYTAVLHKQERIRGQLIKPQEIAFWFKEKPYSLLMKWEKNAVSIDKLLYVEGQENGNMFVHPTGTFAWIKSVKRKPRCEQALKGSLRTADEFGFYRNMQYIHKVLTTAKQSGVLQTTYLGTSTVFGRNAVAMEANFATDPDCKYEKIVMHFDVENIIPVALIFYDRSGNLNSSYAFSNLKINTGITEDTFCKSKNKM